MPGVADFICFMNDTGRGGILTGGRSSDELQIRIVTRCHFFDARIGAHPGDFWLLFAKEKEGACGPPPALERYHREAIQNQLENNDTKKPVTQ
jgi:hypothetical protein